MRRWYGSLIRHLTWLVNVVEIWMQVNGPNSSVLTWLVRCELEYVELNS
jgi:hypothetical protein